jgi:hypothetical protein
MPLEYPCLFCFAETKTCAKLDTTNILRLIRNSFADFQTLEVTVTASFQIFVHQNLRIQSAITLDAPLSNQTIEISEIR